MKRIVLIIESSSTNEIWGRIRYEDNLIVESATNLTKLQAKMKKLLKDFHGLIPDNIEFELQYDIAGLFDEKKFLNTSAVAEEVGINKSLMRQYARGIKHPSFERAVLIEKVIHQLGQELLGIKIAKSLKTKKSV